MIELKKLNGDMFTLNALLIEQIQSFPNTTITLLNGKRIVVQTTKEEIVAKVTTYHQSIGLIGNDSKRVIK